MIRSVIRMCAVAALRTRTIAAERVADSDNRPLVDALIGTEAKPYLVVYTDDDRRTELAGRDVLGAARQLSLTIEYGLASAQLVEGSTGEIVIPHTDRGMEVVLDLLERQVILALFADPESMWGEILKGLIPTVSRVASLRGGSSEKGTNWASRQITFVCDPLADPPPGYVLDDDHPVKVAIALAQAEGQEAAGVSAMAQLIDSVFVAEAGDALPIWRQVQGWLGLTEIGIRGSGTAPLPEIDEEGAALEIEDEPELFADPSLSTDFPGEDWRGDPPSNPIK